MIETAKERAPQERRNWSGRFAVGLWQKIAACAIRKHGNITILTALMLPVTIGGMGLGAEVGFWYFTQRHLQYAADVSAHGAGVRKRAGDPQQLFEHVALDLAVRAGFDSASGKITVNSPPLSGKYAGDNGSLEVVLTDSVPRLFSAFFTGKPVALTGRAVIKIEEGGIACILGMSTTAPRTINAMGTANVALENCDVASNSIAPDSFNMGGSANFTTGCVHTVGLSEVTGGLTLDVCDEVKEMAAVTRDPYRDVAEPAVVGPCGPKKLGKPSGKTIVNPTYDHPSGVKSKRFCHGLHITGDVDFKPGLYIFEDGDLSVNAGAKVTGDGVTFFFTDGAASKLNGSADLNLSAPTNGPFSGLLFFGDRSDAGVQHSVNGSAGSTFQGAIYFPGQQVSYTGGASVTGGCTQIIGLTVTLSGGSGLGSSCDAAGTRDIPVAQGVTVVE